MDLTEYEAGWQLVLDVTRHWEASTSPDAFLRTAQIIEPLALTGDPYACGILDACRSLGDASVG